MELIIVKDQQEGAKKAFQIFEEAIANGAKVLGLATGSTPLALYQEMKDSNLDFSNLVSINLDEYVGLDETDPNSYRQFMQDNLFNEKPFKQSFVPNGKNMNEEEVTAEYDRILAEHPVDLQLLGLGVNGHIAFNEPGTPFDKTTHKVSLTQDTIDANKRFFEKEEDVPRYAYTMGPKSIMAAKKVVLLAFGEGKADAVKGMVEGPVTEDMPASILQNHPDVIVIVDEAAASKLNHTK